jgi:hypothetical protein
MSDIVDQLGYILDAIENGARTITAYDVGGITTARAEIIELRKRVGEREQDMHIRIRGEYDKTIADCWRAKVAELEAELAEARAK